MSIKRVLGRRPPALLEEQKQSSAYIGNRFSNVDRILGPEQLAPLPYVSFLSTSFSETCRSTDPDGCQRWKNCAQSRLNVVRQSVYFTSGSSRTVVPALWSIQHCSEARKSYSNQYFYWVLSSHLAEATTWISSPRLVAAAEKATCSCTSWSVAVPHDNLNARIAGRVSIPGAPAPRVPASNPHKAAASAAELHTQEASWAFLSSIYTLFFVPLPSNHQDRWVSFITPPSHINIRLTFIQPSG